MVQDDNPILVSEGHNLVMVTDGDARGEGAPKAVVAVKWRTSLENGLAHAWREYSGEYVKTSTLVVFLILLLAMLSHVGIGWGRVATEGTLVTLANGSIQSISNLSSEWACVDLKVCIRYDPEDVRQGLELMEQAGKALRAAQPESVLGDPEVLGMDGITEQGAILRMRLKIRRMLVERLAHLFFDHHIDLVMERKTKADA